MSEQSGTDPVTRHVFQSLGGELLTAVMVVSFLVLMFFSVQQDRRINRLEKSCLPVETAVE